MSKSPWGISRLLTVLSLWIATTSGAPDFKSALDSTGRAIGREVLAVKDPIDHLLTTIGYGQCSNVKKLVGVFYWPVAGSVEPDLNGLKLNYISQCCVVMVCSTYYLSLLKVDLMQTKGSWMTGVYTSAGKQSKYLWPTSSRSCCCFSGRASSQYGLDDIRTVNISFDLNSAAESIPSVKNYNTNNNLILYMDGFTESAKGYNFWAISDAFLKRGEYNILGLDVSSLASWCYLKSSTYVRFIGKRLGEVLAAMVKKGQQPRSIHLIGHSLGAHISGFAGKTFRNLTGCKVGRITGLDPAGRCRCAFAELSSELRLKETDAEFVDVIHTDNGVYGLGDPLGHVDFYPNGGSHQPGCTLQTCCHLRAVQLFAESIGKPDAFIGRKCEDYNQFRDGKCSDDASVMGYECPKTSRGKYYLQTDEKEPFGLYEGSLQFVNNEGLVRTVQHTVSSAVHGIGSRIGRIFHRE